ncbi:putative serine/threonine protein kinase sos2 [Leptomonas pyrrhocoris]|uniref:Putative serine/threonine protein kinase sos2 n=1 Tax=Leptomonas pyrrhocoris TaxID=157538 RepID=A0A0M9G9R1_LEPPY|nr:putative serine/threonine protein kinase sos2 [Leptomonas pyrrhocoris]KPA85703.1 putative serine/threonine protein kinase sos2 [Leptomonas pyrrhocoris]|eukprot:XP_015664142.1 putative serine/threonine protein kinase sos2 [Leptomonas pyrrhocoris]
MRRVGDYEILDVLGEGAYSKVKRVRHIPTGCVFVAKIISKTSLQVENDVRLEISILRRLKHRNIVQLIEILESGNNYYIILEPVMGGDLCDVIMGMDSPLPEQDVAALLIQLVAGIHACHRNGVAHRDLKPENLLLGTDGTLKISDFGLSRLHRESNFKASTNEYAHTLTGTLAYVAPEVFEGSYDAFRADIWSLGCIAYVLLTQNFPFGPTTDPHALEERIRNGEPSVMPSYVSAAATDLCMWLLSPSPEDRPTLDEVSQHEFFKKNLPGEYLAAATNRKPPIVQGANMNEFSSRVEETHPNSISYSGENRDAALTSSGNQFRMPSTVRTSSSIRGVSGAATGSSSSSDSEQVQRLPSDEFDCSTDPTSCSGKARGDKSVASLAVHRIPPVAH